MGNKKGLLITLIVIVVILILAIGGFTYAFVATDFLKSNETLFAKYIGETGKALKNFQSENLGAYIEKTRTTPYESEGKLTVKVDFPDLDEKYLELVNGLNITYTGKTDNANKKTEQDVKINYTDDISFPIKYKQTDNLYGIISDIVIKKYIAINADETDKLLEKFGTDTIDENTLGMLKEDASNIDPEAIINSLIRCKAIIQENTTKANYTKTGKDAFTLTISDSKVVTQILNELQNSLLLPESLIEEVEEALINKTFKITVNKSKYITLEIENEMTIGIQVGADQILIIPQIQGVEQKMTMTVTKTDTGNQLSYQIACDMVDGDETIALDIGMQYSNLEGQTVRENYTLGMEIVSGEDAVAYDYTLNGSKKFVSKVEVEPLTSEDSVILNDQTIEYMGTLFTALGTAIEQINTVQMQQLGLEGAQNPLIYATPLGTIYLMNKELNNAVTGEDINQAINDTNQAMAFNAKFENYQGMQKGTVARALVQAVITSNEANAEHLVSVNGVTNKEELVSYAGTLFTSQTYNIIINKDAETGYIKTINIV